LGCAHAQTNAGLRATLLNKGAILLGCGKSYACIVFRTKSSPQTRGMTMNKTISILLLTLIATSALAATGEETYNTTCANCHAKGLAGAPQTGDKKAWGKLIKEGQVELTADGYGGVRAMPAKGGRAELTVAEFAGAVVFMANKAGANWQEADDTMLKKINARIEKRAQAKK
jgi:cytochrome c5